MELVNATRMPAGYTLGLDPDGRERIVVVVKGTFTLPRDGSAPRLAAEQAPLIMADEFTGEPGFSATLYESEYCPFKPRCDVLLNGSAYAPVGKPAERVPVTLRVGKMTKSFSVVGDRQWENGLMLPKVGRPAPFVTKVISYDQAYGGTDVSEKDPEQKVAFMPNPIGIGHYPLTEPNALPGKSLPSTEEAHNPINKPAGKYQAMSFGPIGRNFADRIPYAGTYDDDWVENTFPFLPPDFDPRYFQSAPSDQQIDYPAGGEEIELINLTPEGSTKFPLPDIQVPVEFTNASFKRTECQAALDTLVIEPDAQRLLVIWRASIPLRRNVFEIKQAVVGRMTRGWYRARDLGKTFHGSLADLVAGKSGRGDD